MSVTMPRVMLMACLLSPSLSWALGLGEIHLNSALNEPMNAEIDLISAAPDELSALRATLANREAFTRYGIDKPPFLSSLTFKVGKGKDGRDALLVRSSDAIPEPFVTFLVEVNWSRGRLMREYTVLLDPPVYTPGQSSGASAPVAAPTSVPQQRRATSGNASTESPLTSSAASSARSGASSSTSGMGAAAGDTIRVGPGDTLTRIAHNLHIDSSGEPVKPDVDQAMIALYRSNPDAFGGNINILRQGAILRVPNADQIAALNQKEAMGEVHRQMDAWRSADNGAASSGGHLRLVPPTSGGSATGTGSSAVANANAAETQALKDRVKDLESQLAESKRLIDIRSNELSALQHKLGAAQGPVPNTPPVATSPPPAVMPPAATAPAPSAAQAPPPQSEPTPAAPLPATPVPAAPVASTAPAKKPAPVDNESWIDWVAANWWVPLALLVLVIGALVVAAMRRRRRDEDADMSRLAEDTGVVELRDATTSKLSAQRRGNESFVVEESGPHEMPDFNAESGRFGDTGEMKPPEDTMSSESAVNLDQGDPLAEADFHMAYGLYDQAADLVRIALEREPDRRDLRLKLLEIYFVWGNKDAFLQTAKGLEATRDRAPPGEWDKIVIMGKQICPDEPMFGASAGSGRGAGTVVDLNLEGGENRVDIDLFGDPDGESSLDHDLASEGDELSSVGPSAGSGLHAGDDLDFTLDAPERGADESPTREMPPHDAPTVESELMDFGHENFLDGPSFDSTDIGSHSADAPTTESPALRGAELHDRISSRLPNKTDQTAEVSIDDLGLDLDDLEQTGTPTEIGSHFADTELPSDAPTLVAGLDERARQMMADAEKSARDRDLTELERELEASFIAELDASHQDIKTAVLGPESAPTVLMPRETGSHEVDQSPTSRFQSVNLPNKDEHGQDLDIESTSRLRGINADSIDLDLDRLASALGNGDTVDQPRAAEDLFSSEVFEGTQRNKLVDLDVGDAMLGLDSPTNKVQAQTSKLKPIDRTMPEMEPVTMSEVGTKLDLARAYMDMGDPEGARSILEEVVQEGSTSQKQEASRLIEALPG